MYYGPQHSKALDTHFLGTQQMESPHPLQSSREEVPCPGWLRWPPSPSVPQGWQDPRCAQLLRPQLWGLAVQSKHQHRGNLALVVPEQCLEQHCVFWDVSMPGLQAHCVHPGDG